MSNLQGQTFAGYEILAKLGEGGMGSVYKARQPKLDRLVALKIMSSELAADPDFVTRFKREAAAAASLSHPNVVQVYTAGENEGAHYIAMEFVDGETVKRHIDQQGRLDPREAIAITVYVAEALQYAWNRAKLIHRDIKPDNIFLSTAGEVKVGDLGLAKTVGGATTNLTHTGIMMGSPHYISPEQARGVGDIDFRADIYSLGCTLYHMLTGRPPYEGPDPLSVITKHVNDPPPAIFKVWPMCPIPVALVVGKMLAKHRHQRPASYEDLIDQLREVHDRLRSTATAAPAVAGGPTKATATPTPTPAQPTPKPVVVKATTSRPVTAVKPRDGSAALLYAAAGVAAVAAIAGAVWWFVDRAVETKVLDLGEGVTMTFSVIPPGTFMLGSTKEEQAWAVANKLRQEDADNEGAAPRRATIKQPFWIGQTEATVGQWRQFANARRYVTEAERKGIPAAQGPQRVMGPTGALDWRNPKPGSTPTDNQAVTWITWNDAVAFCKWLDERERDAGRLPVGWVVRLPTEAEWEYACRAGRQTKFWWGDSVEDAKDRLNSAGKGDGFDFIAPVDSFGPRGRNRFGLADMLGNAREWCLDEFDPAGAHEEMWIGNAGWHVQKGGCVFRGLNVDRCAFREKYRRNYRAACTGFRVAVGPDPGAEYAALVVPRGGPAARKGTAASSKSGMLFDGRDTSAWQHPDGSACQWQVDDGALVAGASDLDTREKFQDFQLHIEFAVSRDAKQGNSGVYLQGRYEVQILDSFGKPTNDICCGAIFKLKAPTENVSKLADEWQSFDITFHAARFDAAGAKTANARVSVIHNGRLIHDNVEILKSTGKGDVESATPGPIRLQAYGSPVRFRNIRATPLGAATADSSAPVAQQPRQVIHLLGITDPVKDRIKVERGMSHSKANAWERRGGALAYVSDGGSGKLAPPVAINARSYEIEVDFERLSGPGRFHVDLPLDGNRIIPMNLGNTKLKMINCRAGDPWPANRGSRAHVVVRLDRSPNDTQDRIQVRLDGELVVDWEGNAATVSQTGEPHPDFPGQPVTSIYIHKDSYEVRVWQLRIFDGEATVLRGNDTTSTADAAWQNTINLLPLVDPEKDAVMASWKSTADGLGLEKPKGGAVLELPYMPPEEYDFEIEFTPTDKGIVNQFLSADDRSFVWKMARGKEHDRAVFEVLDGVYFEKHNEGVSEKRLLLETGRRYVSKVEVRRGSLRGLLNEEEFVKWSGDFSRLSWDKIYKRRDGKLIGVGSWGCGVIFHRIEVREISGKGQLARPAP